MGNITATYPGKIDFPTEADGPFEGIMYGEPCSETISYDSSKVPPLGLYEYLTSGGDDGQINIIIGPVTFAANADNSGSPGWPIIQFDQGQFSGISYYRKYSAQDVTY